MTVCEHFSQRSTWPPSAAVRQRSMADITLICSRLTWPALAERPAAPWSRKISATSSFGRDTAAGYAGGGSSPFLSLVFLGVFCFGRARRSGGAFEGGEPPGGDVEKTCGGFQFLVPQEQLDLSEIGILIEQVGGEAVAQRMWRHPLLDARSLGGFVK